MTSKVWKLKNKIEKLCQNYSVDGVVYDDRFDDGMVFVTPYSTKTGRWVKGFVNEVPMEVTSHELDQANVKKIHISQMESEFIKNYG